MKLLLVDNNDSFTYNLVQMIEESALCEVKVIRHDLIKIEEVETYNKILFSPGPSLPDDFPIMKEILKEYAERKSIFGICMGLQAITEFYGGKLFNLEYVIHGQKHQLKLLKEDVLFEGIPQDSSIGLYHSWAADREDFPKNLEIIAENNLGRIMAIRHKKYDIKAFQFHPESIISEYGFQMIKNWLNS